MDQRASIPAEDGLPPIHPGEILLEEFMLPLKLSASALAIALCVSAPRINDLVHGKRGVTADTAIRLARYFGTSPQLWMNLQTSYDLKISQQSLQTTLTRITPRLQAA